MDEVVSISGYLDDEDGNRANGIVTIQISDSSNTKIGQESLYAKNGSFK